MNAVDPSVIRASAIHALAGAVSVSWSAFVGVFLYYTALTLVAIGAAELSVTFVATAYLLPVALYAIVLANRAVRALAAVQIDIGHTPEALLR